MSRLDDLEQRIAALEDEVGTKRGRPGFHAAAASGYVPGHDLHEGPYGYGSQDR